MDPENSSLIPYTSRSGSRMAYYGPPRRDEMISSTAISKSSNVRFQDPNSDPALQLQFEPYLPWFYNKLYPLSTILVWFEASYGDTLVSKTFRDLFVRYKMDRTFGLSLAYRHFELDESERLVHYSGTAIPWKSADGMENMVECKWHVGFGTIRPYEFQYGAVIDKSTEPNPADSNQQEFLSQFHKTLGRYGVTGLFSLCRYPGDDFKGSMEVTRGRAAVNLKLEDCPRNMETHTVSWFFSSPLWKLDYNRACIFEEPSGLNEDNGE